jgi:hypothetical protein
MNKALQAVQYKLDCALGPAEALLTLEKFIIEPLMESEPETDTSNNFLYMLNKIPRITSKSVKQTKVLIVDSALN